MVIPQYLRSYRQKEFVYTFLIDFLFWGIAFSSFTYAGNLIKNMMAQFTQGKTLEEFQTLLTNLPPEQLLALAEQMKTVMYSTFFIAIFLIVGIFLLYSLSQKLIWDYLLNKKTRYWKWNSLNLAIVLTGTVYLLAAGIISIILRMLFQRLTVLVLGARFYDSLEAINLLFGNIINLFFGIGFLIFVFFIYQHFAQTSKVWFSIGDAYINIKKHLKKFFTVLGLSLATIIILTFISLGIQKLIPSTVISFILSMALLAWLRMYVFTSWKST